MYNTSSLPTRKWWATQITALSGLTTSWIVVGGWNQQLSIAVVALVGQAVVGYLVPNSSDPVAASTPVASSMPARSAEAVPGSGSHPAAR